MGEDKTISQLLDDTHLLFKEGLRLNCWMWDAEIVAGGND